MEEAVVKVTGALQAWLGQAGEQIKKWSYLIEKILSSVLTSTAVISQEVLPHNLVPRVSPLHAPGSEWGETLVWAGHVSPRNLGNYKSELLSRMICRLCERRVNNFKAFKKTITKTQTSFERIKRCIEVSPSAPPERWTAQKQMSLWSSVPGL